MTNIEYNLSPIPTGFLDLASSSKSFYT